jgi:hypothetical protein
MRGTDGVVRSTTLTLSWHNKKVIVNWKSTHQ